MDASRDAQQTSGEQAEQSGLGRAEIDDGRAKSGKDREDAEEGREIGHGRDAAADGDGMDGDLRLGGKAIEMNAGRGDDRDGKTGITQSENSLAQDEERLVAGDAEEDGAR